MRFWITLIEGDTWNTEFKFCVYIRLNSVNHAFFYHLYKKCKSIFSICIIITRIRNFINLLVCRIFRTWSLNVWVFFLPTAITIGAGYDTRRVISSGQPEGVLAGQRSKLFWYLIDGIEPTPPLGRYASQDQLFNVWIWEHTLGLWVKI